MFTNRWYRQARKVDLSFLDPDPPLPPWIVFRRDEETGDILPAGRPGAILEGLPLDLADALVHAANQWRDHACMYQDGWNFCPDCTDEEDEGPVRPADRRNA
jgi:hypothetical protein